MSNFFNRPNQNVSQMQLLLSRYNSARANLIIVAILTAINSLMLIANTYTYFLFSATIPYILIDNGLFWCGMYPEEIYQGELASIEFLPKPVFFVLITVAIITIALYVLCAVFSTKQRVGWLIGALVMFSIDTLVMFLYYGFAIDMMIDILFHIWIIVILSMGVASHFKLKNLPEQTFTPPIENTTEASEESGVNSITDRPDSAIIRPASNDVRFRILAAANLFEHNIVYRRVGKTNEFVIDNNVYDEYTAFIERSHVLTANIDGHAFSAGFDGANTYITVDGQVAVKKIRII